MQRSSLIPSIALAAALSTTGAYAQSAHVHGEGRLNIAFDGNRVFMALESPGADIVGFEHAPRSEAERAAVASALQSLDKPAQMLRFDGDADCRVVEASAELEAEEHGHDEDHEHDQHGKNDERHDPSEHHEHEEGHEHEDHDSHDDEDTHSAFVAEYVFDCDDVEALTAIEFGYFERFENARSLDVVLIDGSGQRRLEVDRADPVLRLAR